MFKLANNTNTKFKYIALVRYMAEVKESSRPPAIIQYPFTLYTWETTSVLREGRRINVPVTGIIDISTIISPAFIVPAFAGSMQPSPSNPKLTDKFWYMDRKFCDRAGWDNINDIDDNSPMLRLDRAHMDVNIHVPMNIVDGVLVDLDVAVDVAADDFEEAHEEGHAEDDEDGEGPYN